MPENVSSTAVQGGLVRPLAIGLMILGAAGFVAGRLLLGEQVWCMLGSTLLVFLGLGILLYARRNRAEAQPAAAWTHPPQPVPPSPEANSEPHGPLALLADFVTDSFQRQGAQVTVANQRPDRSILLIDAPGGGSAVAIVHEGTGPVEVSELRALAALVYHHKCRTGFYVTDGYFSPDASTWAEGKPLRLIEKGQFERLSLD